VELRIIIEVFDPPSGVVVPGPGSAERDGAVAFVGWLDLLRVLADLVGSAHPPGSGA
jgi:hypothetical protein